MEMLRPRLTAILRGAALAALSASILAISHSPAAAASPNILVVLVDDLRWDDLGCAGHPFSKTPHMDRVAREGARFLNAFAVAALCSPSRATLLTGLYPHSHGITDNTERGPQSHKLTTFPQSLQRAGYRTAFIGKWHMGNDDSRRPGFDHWICLKGQGSSFDSELNVNGTLVKSKGHVTDALHEQAMAFLRQPRTQPFLLYLSHKAVHPETVQRGDGSLSDPTASTFVPATRHEELYRGEKIPRRPNAVAPRNKPALQRPIAGLPPLGPETGSSDESILGRLRMLAGVDESLGGLLRQLEDAGELDRTLVVFYGEHGLSVERRLAYEEAIRIPLLMRLPGAIRAGSTPVQFALTLDLAPTLLDFAGAAPLAKAQGRSLKPILDGSADDWRTEFLIEHHSDKVFPRTTGLGYRAVRSDRWKLIRYLEHPGMDELYDLTADPYERNNVIADPKAQSALAEMKARLTRLTADEATTSSNPTRKTGQ